MSQQNAVNLFRAQFQAVHNGWLEPTMQGVTAAQAHWQAPGGRAAPGGAQYAHHIIAMDFLFLGFVRQGAPLAASTFAGKTGLSEPYPMQGDWDEWARKVRIDLDALRQYAQAVYTALDAQLASLNDEDLATPVDMTPVGLGQQTVGSFLTTLLIHGAAHTGEIAVTKGLQGLQGYPF
ncbi:MAG: hypothetical protein QG637_923 [Chloroflexota bacterium]|nr:hypothetical protein [Chloroflexota bacterium]